MTRLKLMKWFWLWRFYGLRFFCFACQPLVFRCSSMSFSTLSNLYLDDEVEAHRVIWADFLRILHSQFLISFANRDRNFRCFARQLLAFRCPSLSFPTMSAWCFDDEIEAQEMILELTCLVAFVFPFFGEAFVIVVRSFRFFCCSAFDFSMFLNVFSNNVNVMFWWRDWSSWNDFGSDVIMVWGFFLFCLSVVDFSMSFSVFFNIFSVIIKWLGWSSWNPFGSDLFGVFCIPVFDESFTFRVSSCFACCPVAFVLLSLGEAFVILVRIVRSFAAQPLVFRCSSMSLPTISTWCFDDEIEAHEMILALTFLWFEVFLFCLSAVGFSMFLNVFFNLVNFIFRWWGWSSSSDLGRLFVDFAFTIPNKLC